MDLNWIDNFNSLSWTHSDILTCMCVHIIGHLVLHMKCLECPRSEGATNHVPFAVVVNGREWIVNGLRMFWQADKHGRLNPQLDDSEMKIQN